MLDRPFLTVSVATGLACASAIVVIAIASFRQHRGVARSRTALAPYRSSLITVASGEDEGGQAQAELSAVPASIWVRLRPSVLSLLTKVRGLPADNLGELMRAHGEIDRATRMLTSRLAGRRADAAYMLGLVHEPQAAKLVLPLLSDSAQDVRLAAARALGAIGDPAAASGVLHAIRTGRGQIGLPTSVAAEALLPMGLEIGPVLQIGLVSKDPAVRNVCAVVAGHGTYLSAAPQLRVLLGADTDDDVRVSSAEALGRVGGPRDGAILARHTDLSEPTVLRRTCVAALGELGQRESLQDLVKLLADDDRRLAELAADSLVRIGDEGIALLEKMVAHPGPEAEAAGGALAHAGLRANADV